MSFQFTELPIIENFNSSKIFSFQDSQNLKNYYVIHLDKLYYYFSETNELLFKLDLPVEIDYFQIIYDIDTIKKISYDKSVGCILHNQLFCVFKHKFYLVELSTLTISNVTLEEICDFYQKRLNSSDMEYCVGNNVEHYYGYNNKIIDFSEFDKKYGGDLDKEHSEGDLYRYTDFRMLENNRCVYVEEKMTAVPEYSNEHPDTLYFKLYYGFVDEENKFITEEVIDITPKEEILSYLPFNESIWFAFKNDIIEEFNYRTREKIRFQILKDKIIFSNFKEKENSCISKQDAYTGGFEGQLMFRKNTVIISHYSELLSFTRDQIYNQVDFEPTSYNITNHLFFVSLPLLKNDNQLIESNIRTKFKTESTTFTVLLFEGDNLVDVKEFVQDIGSIEETKYFPFIKKDGKIYYASFKFI